MVNVAQLVRALDCGSKGRGFESHLSPTEGCSFIDGQPFSSALGKAQQRYSVTAVFLLSYWGNKKGEHLAMRPRLTFIDGYSD